MRTKITKHEADKLKESLQSYLMRKFNLSVFQLEKIKDDFDGIIGEVFEIADPPAGANLSTSEDWGEPFDGVV